MSDHSSSSDQPGNGAGAGERPRDARQFFVGPEAVGKAPPGRSTEADEAPERSPAAAPAPVVAVSAPPRHPAPLLPVEDSPPPPDPDPSPAPVLAPPSVPAAPPSPAPAPAASPSGPPKFYVPAPGAPPPRESSLGLGRPPEKAAKAASDGAARGPVPARPEPVRPAGPPKRRRVRRRILQAVAVLVLVPLVLIGAGLVWAQNKFSQIERIQVSEVLDAQVGDGLNILMVGSDEGADRAGQRSDTIMLMRLEPERSLVMSIPRDLFVEIAGTGREQRINAAYNDGPTTLIQTIQQNLDLPIHRYMEVDFVTFASLVDSIGGVTIEFPHPVSDFNAGLYIEQTGPVLLDGAQALAYVRARTYVETIDGREVPDARGDLGRVERQQIFMRTLFAKIGESRNPFRLMDIGSSLVGGLRIDDDMSLLDAIRLALRLDDLQPESVVLPTFPFRSDAGAAVLGLDDDAEAALEQFR